MPSYISSNANRFYAALENAYGQVGTIGAANRIPALKLTVQQQQDTATRKDKTGSRTYPGMPIGGRRKTNFELRTYLTSWNKSAGNPSYGPLFQGALGETPMAFGGGVVASYNTTGTLGFTGPHLLTPGQAVTSGGEIRFVAAIVDGDTVQLNAPFTVPPATGATLGTTVTYMPATELPSVTVFDYWSPTTAVQRLLSGAAVDQMEVVVNGDYHEVRFSGIAKDVVDNAGDTGGSDLLTGFPQEPALDSFDYSIVPGNLGQAWIGTTATQFFTITTGSLMVKNNLDTRFNEFGSSLPCAIAPGQRTVTAAFDLYSMDDDATRGLYQAARQQSPISVMFQLGETPTQVMGVYLKSVVPEVPEFDDTANRLQWHFRASRAQGTVDDEITVAFA
jgi:hypothetical protein